MSGDLQYRDVRAAALGLVGNAISALGGERPAKLPVGFRKSPLDCVISRAFRASLPQPVAVYCDRVLVSDRGDATAVAEAWGVSPRACSIESVDEDMQPVFGNTATVYDVQLPEQLQAFIDAFDAGELPDLDAELRYEGLTRWFDNPYASNTMTSAVMTGGSEV